MAITPFLLFSANRNGSTWLSNILYQNFEISAIAHEMHYGVLEIDLFNYLNFYNRSFDTIESYLEFISTFSQSDLFICSNLDKKDFLGSSYDDYLDFFLDFMDKICEKNGTKYWLVKIDPNLLIYPKKWKSIENRIENRYSIIKYISIKRDFNEYIVSLKALYLLNGYKKIKTFLLLCLQTSIYSCFYRKINNQIKQKGGLKIRFEDLKKNSDYILQIIESTYNLERKCDTSNFIKNTSSEKTKINKVSSFYSLFQNKMISYIIINLYKFSRHFIKPKSPLWWKISKSIYYTSKFKDQLLKSSHDDLAKYLDSDEEDNS